MRERFSSAMITVARCGGRCQRRYSMSITGASSQTPVARPASVGGKPNFIGIWRSNSEAN